MTTDLLDQFIQQKRDRQERDRVLTIQKIQQWLNQHGLTYGVREAYIFGSLSRPGHFHDASDVDIAVLQINPELQFQAMSLLSAFLGRDVDLIELAKCPFQHRIRETGIRWTAPPD